MAKVIYLKISSFRGISFGAEHWYGQLVMEYPGPNVDITYVMTEEDAAKLNAKEEYPWYKAGEESTRFKTKQQVIDAAITYFCEHYDPELDFLIEGDPIYMYNPMYHDVLIGEIPINLMSNKSIDMWLRTQRYGIKET